MAGLTAVHARITRQQTIAVGLSDTVVDEAAYRVPAMIVVRELADQRAHQRRDITRSHVMLWIRQACAVDEMAVFSKPAAVHSDS